MPGKAYVKVTKTKIRTKKGTKGKGGNPNHCPVCGKFMGKKKS